MELRGTTILGVRKDGKCAIAGDGQVTLGENTIMKHSAKKYAGSTMTALLSVLPVLLRMLLR